MGNLRASVLAANTQATAAFGDTYASSLGNVLQTYKALLSAWPGIDPDSITITGENGAPNPTLATWFRGYKPIKTRQLAGVGSQVYHPAPYNLEEARYRGARTYCALREAARQQDATGRRSMGSRQDGSLAYWTLGASESTVSIAKPYKNTTAATANAFVIPIAIGSRLAPIKGFGVPTVGQIVHPVSMITADSVVVSYENSGNEAWINSQHVDAFTGQRIVGVLNAPKIPLVQSGFFTLTAGLNLTAKYGVLLPNSGSSGPFSTPLASGVVTNVGPLAAPGVTPARTYLFDELTAGHYRPSAVASDSRQIHFEGLYWDIREDDDYEQEVAALHGDALRMGMKDDRAISVGDSLKQTLSLTASGGFSYSASGFSLSVGISGSSSIDYETQRITTIREHISAVNGDHLLPEPVPGEWVEQANVLIVPESKHLATVNPLTVQAVASFSVQYGFGSYSRTFSHTLYKSPSFALNDTTQHIGGETKRLRAGSYTFYGLDYFDPGTNWRSTYSHLPQPSLTAEESLASFPSFPDNGPDSVSACLQTAGTVGNAPPPTPGEPATDPDLDICVYGPSCWSNGDVCVPWGLPSNICSPGVIAGYTTSPCVRSALEFLCAGSPRRIQTWGSHGRVIARSLDPDQVAAIQNACFDESEPSSQSEADLLAGIVNSLFHYGLCNNSMYLQGVPVQD